MSETPVGGPHVPMGEPSTPSNRRHHPLLNPDCVQQHSRGMFWLPTKVPDEYRAVGEREMIGVDSKP